MGVAYVVTRPGRRFEIRESLHTPGGSRARSLAGFDVLTDAVLARAARRAQRPFDVGAVLASGRRAGAPSDGRRRRSRPTSHAIASCGPRIGWREPCSARRPSGPSIRGRR